MKTKHFKRLLSLFAAVCMLCTMCVFELPTMAATKSGTWGDLTWTLSDAGLLTISGNGTMDDMEDEYENYVEGAWRHYLSSIKNIEIGSGVTSIGAWAFEGCEELLSISIPDSIESIGFWAFKDCIKATSLIIGSGLTTMDEDPFIGCIGIETITVSADNGTYYSEGNCLLERSDNAVKLIFGCKSSIIPTGVTIISKNAFNGCKDLKSINIPSTVDDIYYSAFCSCTGLESITVDEDNEEFYSENNCILEYVYGKLRLVLGCKNSIIPENVTEIGPYAFYGCTGLVSVVIPDSVDFIGNDAFALCTNIKTVSVGKKVGGFSLGAFSGCTSLTTINFPDSVNYIGNEVFVNCTSLNSISLPDKDIAIAALSFENTGYFNNRNNWENGVLYIGSHLYVAEDSISSVSIKEGTKSIAQAAFMNCKGLTSVTIPDNITEIMGQLFEGCSNLREVRLPESIDTINFRVFYECNNLQTVYYGGSELGWAKIYIASSGNEKLSECNIVYGKTETISDSGTLGNLNWTIDEKGLLTVSGEGDMEAIYDDSAWKEYARFITKVKIEDGVTSVGDYAFDGCVSLTSADIPDSVDVIGYGAFRGCSKLTEIDIPCAVYDEAFSGCSELASINISNKVDYIGKDVFTYTAFYNDDDNWKNGMLCLGRYLLNAKDSITSVNIGKETEVIAHGSFENCTEIESINVSDENEYYYSENNCLLKNDDTYVRLVVGCKNSVIPEYVNGIGSASFYSCEGLTSISIPNSVTEIGYYAFSGCVGLKTLTIGKNVKSIDPAAFYGCTALETVHYNGTESGWKSVYIGDDNEALTECEITYEKALTGTWGNLIWKLDDDGTLTISGNGDMQEFEDNIYPEWQDYFSSIKHIVIENGVTSICVGAFPDFTELLSVSIPSSVITIGSFSFCGCSKLRAINIPEGVKNIYYSAFFDCCDLSAISIPSSVNFIGYQAFENTAFYNNAENWKNELLCMGKWLLSAKDGIASVNIGKDIEFIADGAFARCSHIENITVSDVNKKYYSENNCLLESTGTDIMLVLGCKNSIIPENVSAIAAYAFENCTELISIVVPDNVNKIGEYAFYDCVGLKSITIGKSVKSIDSYALFGCAALESLYYKGSENDWNKVSVNEEGNDYYLNTCSIIYANASSLYSGKCDNLSWSIDNNGLLTITGTGAMNDFAPEPQPVKSIRNASAAPQLTAGSEGTGNKTWRDYKDLIKYVVISEGITSIGNNAFSSLPNLKSVFVPSSVKTIGDNSFANCAELKTVYGNLESVTVGTGNETLTESNIVSNHVHTYIETVVEPTAEKQGYTHHVCTECVYTYDDNFISLGKTGDVNGDGEIKLADAMMVFKHVAKVELLSEKALKAADCNKDGEIKLADAMAIFKFVAKVTDKVEF